MKWIAISGSWRTVNSVVEQDVRAAVAAIIAQGDGIVTGGALGVDYIATQEALRQDPHATHTKVIIPSSLDVYVAHYRRRAHEGVITVRQAESLIGQLTNLRERNRAALIEMHHTELNETSYYDRNTQVLAAADELMAFQVNRSAGTQDAIDKARKLGMKIHVYQYDIS